MQNVDIKAGASMLQGVLQIPPSASGIVLFVHGSGSGRHSPRNQLVANTLQDAGIATLLFDLLTPEEEAIDLRTRHLRFDIRLLSKRLVDATRWIENHGDTRHLRVGYFGASTGGAAALVAAAELGDGISAVVSRGGRPDLAADALTRVRSPTLLIVGGLDHQVIHLNRHALAHLRCEKQLQIVPDATHLFEEPGALEQVARLATNWFRQHLSLPAESSAASSSGFIRAPASTLDAGDNFLPYEDRGEAGAVLAKKLLHYADRPDVLVLALPRGGMPVAFEVAKALNAPLDVFVVRKLGVPGQAELAMGAIATGGVRVVNQDIVDQLGISAAALEAVAAAETRELTRREHAYRGQRLLPAMRGLTVILVDDGLATGSTMRAAVQALRKQNPARIVVGVPVAAASTCEEFRSEVDEIICAATPAPFYSVGHWYRNFSQTTDEEVHHLLAQAGHERPNSMPLDNASCAMQRKPTDQ